MATVLVIVFVALMVVWWQAQGLFSALIHLVVTLLAAMVTLALWEPMVYGFLLGRQPESAWGLSFMAIFGLSLLLMRVVTDKVVPGNLNFANIVDRIGGGACGFFSGVLTAGVLVIGIQLTGVNSFAGYRGWKVDESGTLVRDQALFANADGFTANLLARFSSGSFSTGNPLRRYHPNLAAEASLFSQDPFDDSRQALAPGNARIDPTTFAIVNTAPGELGRSIDLPQGYKLVIVPVDVVVKAVKPEEGRRGGADADGRLRIARSQVALAATDDTLKRGSAELYFPLAYIQSGQFRAFTVEGDFAWSIPGSDSAKYHWVFAIPSAQEPLDLRIKNLRLDLPDPKSAVTDERVVAGLISDKIVALVDGEGENGETKIDDETELVSVTAALPFTFDRNKLTSVEVQGDTIVSGRGQLRAPNVRVGRGLAVNKIYCPRDARIVQVHLGTRSAGSMLGKAMASAVNATQTPILKDDAGNTYSAQGWAVIRGSTLDIALDPQNPVRSLAAIDLGRLSGTDRVLLYFQVPIGVHLTSFNLGTAIEQEIDVPVE